MLNKRFWENASGLQIANNLQMPADTLDGDNIQNPFANNSPLTVDATDITADQTDVTVDQTIRL